MQEIKSKITEMYYPREMKIGVRNQEQNYREELSKGNKNWFKKSGFYCTLNKCLRDLFTTPPWRPSV